MDVAELIVDLSNPNKKRAAAASADLAALIWAGAIDEEMLIQWLESHDEQLRATTSWAVSDAGRPVAPRQAARQRANKRMIND